MEPDVRLTFDSFVVGPANRLAAAAARRTADQPGRSYNPLFVYSASGLGKSHILSAVAHRARKQYPERVVIYEPLEVYLGALTQALERGERGQLEARYADADLLLLDDVQFIAGQGQAQEMLLRTLDAITTRGGQVVLASDRPPAEIDGLDDRLLSRFSGGLIVDMGRPDLETRVAIIRKKAASRNAFLAPGVSETLARFPFQNIRELEGALNRIIAVQELEERAVEASELSEMIRRLSRATGGDAGGDEEESREEPRWKQDVRRAARAAEEDGFLARRLRRLLERDAPPEDWEASIRRFQADLARAREIRLELNALGNPWPEAATTLLKDPDRLEEGEALLASARERSRPFARISDGPSLDELEDYVPALALRAADRLMSADRPDYNPLFVHDDDGDRARVFLEAAGRSYLRVNPKARVGFISVQAFAEEFIRAISDGVAGAWRERWWTVEVLLLHGLEDLADTERAQDEFFHLFEALRRRDARIFLGSNRLPSEIENVDDRLRSRFEGGLVVELEGPELPAAFRPTPDGEPVAEERLASAPSGSDDRERDTAGEGWADPALAGVEVEEAASKGTDTPLDDDLLAVKELAGLGTQPRERASSQASSGREDTTRSQEPAWVPSPERVVWSWPADEERLLEDF
jgi:chromosomal replication initiator protein